MTPSSNFLFGILLAPLINLTEVDFYGGPMQQMRKQLKNNYILVVDDVPFYKDFYLRALNYLFHDVAFASNRREALRSVWLRGSPPALVLVNSKLLDPQGAQLCQKIKKLFRGDHVPFLAVIERTKDIKQISHLTDNQLIDDVVEKPHLSKMRAFANRVRHALQTL